MYFAKIDSNIQYHCVSRLHIFLKKNMPEPLVSETAKALCV